MVSSRGTLVNKLDTSKEYMKTLGSMLRFCMVLTSGVGRIFSRGRPEFFEKHSPGAVVKPSESSRYSDIEAFSPQEMMGVCGFLQNVKKLNPIAHKNILH